MLFRVTATDLDIGDNGRIDYSINAEVERFVTVDRDSGVVRAGVSLDRELVSELNIYLTATDRGQPSRSSSTRLHLVVLRTSLEDQASPGGPRGQPSRSSSTRLHLVVLDLDDNGPEFDVTRFRLRVAENQPAGTEVRQSSLLSLSSCYDLERPSTFNC